MKRKIYDKLLEWKYQECHKPLILNGVRQCGKTYILKEFGRAEFDNLAYSNIFCFIRVKLSAKILFLFRISNKNDSFLFLLLIINRFGTHFLMNQVATSRVVASSSALRCSIIRRPGSSSCGSISN